MVEFIVQHGGNIDIKTFGEQQTAIHYAAKNDAINSLQMLLGHGASIDARDSRNRTPLQVRYAIIQQIAFMLSWKKEKSHEAKRERTMGVPGNSESIVCFSY